MPVAVPATLEETVTIGSLRIRVRTQRGEIHQAGKGNSPVIRSIDNVATIELEQLPALDTWETKCNADLPEDRRLAIGST